MKTERFLRKAEVAAATVKEKTEIMTDYFHHMNGSEQLVAVRNVLKAVFELEGTLTEACLYLKFCPEE